MFRAIIVDDEPQIRKGLRTIISWETAGFVIIGEAADGDEALSLIARQPPDLVITDVKMPHKDGIELSRQIQRKYPDIAVLILSGYNQFTYAKEAMKYGVVDYILKPVDPEELMGILGQLYRKLSHSVQLKLENRQVVKTMKNALFGKLIRGELTAKPYEAAAAVGVELRNTDVYRMIAISVDRYDEILSVSGEELALKRFAIENVIGELIGSRGYLFEISERCYGCLAVESAADHEADGDLFRLADRMADAIQRYVKEPASVGVGSAVTGIEQIQESCLEALQMAEYRRRGLGDPEKRIRAAVEYVDSHYKNDLNLKGMARLFHYNAVYFGQLFKKETDYYFNDYLNQVRITHACRMLEQTDLSASEISERVGYKYVDHFYRHFKLIKGMTPGKYRETGK